MSSQSASLVVSQKDLLRVPGTPYLCLFITSKHRMDTSILDLRKRSRKSFALPGQPSTKYISDRWRATRVMVE